MESQITNWKTFAEMYSDLPQSGGRFLIFRDLPDLIKKHVRGTKVLDYGCGPGRSTSFLKLQGFDVDGVDNSNETIEFIKQRDPSGKYSTIESGVVPSENAVYDFVYAGFVFPHVSSKSEMIKITKEFVRVLKPGGTLIASAPSEHAYKHEWSAMNTDFIQNKAPSSGDIVKMEFKNLGFMLEHYYWTDEDYCDVLKKGGIQLAATHQPLGRESDGVSWISETKYSPVTLYVAKKI